MQVILDGKKILSERDFHKALNEALDFGPYYGNNLNALWDVLTTDVARPCEIIWTDFAASEEAFGKNMKLLLKVLDDVVAYDLSKKSWTDKFSYRMER